MLAHYSQDKELINAYAQGRDLYATAASKIFNKDYWECMEHWEDGSANPEGKKLRGITKNIILGRQKLCPIMKKFIMQTM